MPEHASEHPSDADPATPTRVLAYRPQPRSAASGRRLWFAMLLLAVALAAAFILLFIITFEFEDRLVVGVAATPAAPLDFDKPSDFRFSPFKSDRASYTVHAL